jgi:sialate O-acetylesterase
MKKPGLILFFLTILQVAVWADVRLPLLFQSNMVLQRDKDCAIWGTADPKEKVSVQLKEQTYKTVADNKGKWKIILPSQPAGGPFQVVIKGKNVITLDNVLFGDVWICGGQSNMQFHVNETGYKNDSVKDNNSSIRIFTAGLALNYTSQDTLTSGEWKIASVASIQNFSAVAFFFGRSLQEKLNVPIGLISDNLGATAVETWMSPEAIRTFPQFSNYYNAYLAPQKDFKQLTDAFEKIKPDWKKNYYLKDDPGLKQQWFLPSANTDDWKVMEMPGFWEDKGLPGYNGSVWFRREFELPKDYKGGGYHINLGQVDDYNTAWVNGHEIGENFGNLNYSNYIAADSILKPGTNVLVVRIMDVAGKGGMYNMFWDWTWVGKWKYKTGLKIDTATFVKPRVVNGDLFNSPSLLFNGCIAPVSQLSIKGAIWYQGESNAARAEEYKQLFPAFIQDWRKQFNQPGLPFLFVQLANYYPEAARPSPSEWAELREAQASALALPNTGMAVAIDIGEAADIHPKNKQDVGKRLAIAALKTAYNIDTVHTTPLYDHSQVSNDSVIVYFKTEELVTKDKYGYVRGFCIAGPDSVFHWAKAYIRGTAVVVYNETVKQPVAVRYAWADNPGTLDLYNREGLPAAPFRTDNWKGATAGKKFSYVE